MSAIFPVIATVQALFFFDEERVLDQTEIISKFQGFSLEEILNFIEEKKLKSYLFYIIVMLLWPNTINGLRYFLIDDLLFSTTDIGLIFTISSLFYVVYMFFMNTFFSNYTLKNYYYSICFMMIINIIARYLQLTPSLYSLAFLFATIDQSINNLFYDLPSIPLLALVCRNCPDNKEATYYGFFVSVSNFFCSFANFTGYFFLNTMDVSETCFTNVQSVNMLCLIWAFMCWNLTKYLHFPDNIKVKIKTKDVKTKEYKLEQIKKENRMPTDEDIDYSDPPSEGIDLNAD